MDGGGKLFDSETIFDMPTTPTHPHLRQHKRANVRTVGESGTMWW